MIEGSFADQKAAALLVPCIYCHAKPGEPCHNKDTGQPLQFAPAHIPRLKAAEEVPF